MDDWFCPCLFSHAGLRRSATEKSGCATMVICRLAVLSRFNVMKTPAEQLSNLVNYKRCYFYGSVIGVPLAVFGICVTVFYEHTASPLGLFFVSLGVLAGASCAYFGWKKHKNTMVEIEQNLEELKNFE